MSLYPHSRLALQMSAHAAGHLCLASCEAAARTVERYPKGQRVGPPQEEWHTAPAAPCPEGQVLIKCTEESRGWVATSRHPGSGRAVTAVSPLSARAAALCMARKLGAKTFRIALGRSNVWIARF